MIIRPRAYWELDDLAEYLAQSSETAARRLVEAAEETFPKIAQMPEIGSLCHFADPRLQGLRCWPVSGFKNYLIFYRPIEGGIEVLHILHGARDLAAFFEGEAGA
jgi:toxin ParE1/3/4